LKKRGEKKERKGVAKIKWLTRNKRTPERKCVLLDRYMDI
jgi:hypothetical protein